MDLYAVEETPEAEPKLVAKNVIVFDSGDFGFMYWQHK